MESTTDPAVNAEIVIDVESSSDDMDSDSGSGSRHIQSARGHRHRDKERGRKDAVKKRVRSGKHRNTQSMGLQSISSSKEKRKKRRRGQIEGVDGDHESAGIRSYDARPWAASECAALSEVEGVGDGTVFDADLSRLALDSAKRDDAKSAKNATFGGFEVRPNYRYRLDDGRIGQCRYIGFPLFAKSSEQWIGMVIEFNGDGEHDGSVHNKSYFRCRDGKGLFVRPHRLIEDLGINTIELTPRQIEGDEAVRRHIRRRERERVRKERKRKKTRNQRAKSMSTNTKWAPPPWADAFDGDHGSDFLEQKPFYPKLAKKARRGHKHQGATSLTLYDRSGRQ